MSNLIRRNLTLLKKLYKARVGDRRIILKTVNDDFLNALCEIVINILSGKIPLTTKQYTTLKKKKHHMRMFGDKRVNLDKKKRIINQHGAGFILPLLGAALPFITSLFSRK